MKKRMASLLLSMALAASLTGCGGETRDSAQTVTETAIKAVQTMDLTAMRSDWGEDAFGDTPLGEVDETTQDLMKLITAKLTYKVTDAVEDEKAGTATVTVEFTNLDMAQIFSEFMGSMISEAFSYAFLPEDQQPTEEELQETYMASLKELLAREDNETVTSTVEIPLTLSDDGWKIAPSDEIIDAMFGGLYSFTASMGDAFQ